MLLKKVQLPDSRFYRVVEWSPESVVFTSEEQGVKLIAQILGPGTALPSLAQLSLEISCARLKPWSVLRNLLGGQDLRLSTDDIASSHVELYVGHDGCKYFVLVPRDGNTISALWLPLEVEKAIAESSDIPLELAAKAYINPSFAGNAIGGVVKDGLTILHFGYDLGAINGKLLYSTAEL